MDGGGELDPPAGSRAVASSITAVCLLLGLAGGFVAMTQWRAEPTAREPVERNGWQRVEAPGGAWSVEVPGALGAERSIDLTTIAGARQLRVAAARGAPVVELGTVTLGAGDRSSELHAVADAYLAATRTISDRYDAVASPLGTAGSFSGRRGDVPVSGIIVADEAGRALTVLVVGDATSGGEALLRVVGSIRAR